MIDVTGLSFTLGDKPILDTVDACLPVGQITALIGPNGAGKSTLLKLIAQQLTASWGRICLSGCDLRSITPEQLARRMAVVGQQLDVASRVRVCDLVGFGRWPHSRGRLRAEDQAAIADALALFELDELRDRFLDELSGGQRQRAFIAMAYAQDTDWLLLDEPLNNLDLNHARNLMAQLRHLADTRGKSIVIVLHDLNYAISWADHVVALAAGRVAFAGPVAEVATSESLSALYQTPVALRDVEGRPIACYHG
ncbi:ATP-binding cassette domain-containing protein (plasmid) [Phaeobacter inhibens]|uniref:iron ABC transporter ATP-binding protein n=1 Tax=Phaeobacter inhibens TaxID=221822 RepID=UPI0021A426F9|nr:ATP-binding cassette domain-containing protein [Phaeobacter inhibens]UWR70832.1 ATP-binding cassette domain-containing protein [Phaeobacter inhibens]